MLTNKVSYLGSISTSSVSDTPVSSLSPLPPPTPLVPPDVVSLLEDLADDPPLSPAPDCVPDDGLCLKSDADIVY